MRYKIPIKSKTRNARAGAMETAVAGLRSVWFTFNREVDDERFIFCSSWVSKGFKLANTATESGLIFAPDRWEYLYGTADEPDGNELKEMGLVGMRTEGGSDVIHHHPIPEFAIKYHDAEVECERCEARFDWTDLEFESNDFGHSSLICPLCGCWHCCEIEFEDESEWKGEIDVE